MTKKKQERLDELVGSIKKQIKKEKYERKEWYTARALLGNQWANWFMMIGARER